MRFNDGGWHVSTKTIESLIEQSIFWGLRLGGVIVALLVAWNLASWLQRRVRRRLEKVRVDVTLASFVGTMVRYALFIATVVACMGVVGIQTTSFAAVIAASSFAIGLAFQGALSNFAAGVMLLVFRPYKYQDLVTVDGEHGHVESLELFTTVLKTGDGRQVIIPNSKVFGAKIVNFTHFASRRTSVLLQVDPRASVERTREVLDAALRSVADIETEPAAAAVLLEIKSASTDWDLRAWVKNDKIDDVRERMLQAAKQALEDAGIDGARPPYEVRIDNGSAKPNRAAAPSTAS